MEDSSDHPSPALMTITELVPSPGKHQPRGNRTVGFMLPEHDDSSDGGHSLPALLTTVHLLT